MGRQPGRASRGASVSPRCGWPSSGSRRATRSVCGGRLRWNSSFHALAVLEVFLTLRWLLGDSSPTLAQAIVFEALNRVMTVAFKFVPFRIGVDEALSGALAPMLALNPTAGVSLAVVRKVRSLFWSAIGLGIVAAHPTDGTNSKFKIQNSKCIKPHRLGSLHFEFCILHFVTVCAGRATSDGSPRNLVCASVLSAAAYVRVADAHPQPRGGVVAFRCRRGDDERIECLLDGVRAGGRVIEHHEARVGAECGEGTRAAPRERPSPRQRRDRVSRGCHPDTTAHPRAPVRSR